MFKNRIVFVVGAGASCEANLPAGDALKGIIAAKLDIRFRGYNERFSGDERISSALQRHAGQTTNDYLHAAWQLRDALPLAISVDNLLDAHRDNDKAVLCGKVGVAAAILEAERNSLLYGNPREQRSFEYQNLRDSWYAALAQLLTQDIPKSGVEDIFTNVAFITFNYDRCIEHFLVHAISTYYGLSHEAAASMVNKLTILHPYGVVGRLPWQAGGSAPIEFGSDGVDLIAIATQLRTFTERIEEGGELNRLRELVSHAETLVFLGFAFHRQNMQLLKPAVPTNAKAVLATTMGISGSDAKVVHAQIEELTGVKVQTHLASTKCGALFKEYWRTLSAA